MSTALTIASRELRDRARLFLVAAVLAVVPFLIALLPGARADRATTVAMTGGVFAVALSFATAIALGTSTIGRELAEKRLSFLFSKPVSPAAIWFGKMLSALVTSLGCFLLIIIPTYLTSRQVWVTTTLHYAAAAAVVFLFFVSHAISTMVRSRSALVALDFVCALVSAVAAYLIVRPLLLGGAVETALQVIIAIGAALLVILAVAPVVQLTAGRTDARRNHSALSRAIWIPLAVVLALATGYVTWFTHPSDLVVVALTQSSSSDMAVVTGSSPSRGGFMSTLLVDAKGGRRERLSSPPWWGAGISRDGSTLAWLQPNGPWNDGMEVYTRDLRSGDARSVATGINTGSSARLILSDDGSRVALLRGGGLAVYETASGKLLASAARFDQRAGHAVYFATPDVVRVVEFPTSVRNASPVPFTISELDVTQRKLTQTGAFAAPGGYGSLSVSPDGSKMFLRGNGVIADARTGATLAVTGEAPGRPYTSAMLRDGGVAAVSRGADHARLAIYGADGKLARELALPAPMAMLSAQTTDGRLILLGYTGTPQEHGKGRTMFVVDPQRGTIERTANDVKGPLPQFTADPRLTQFRAGMKLAGVDREGQIVEW